MFCKSKSFWKDLPVQKLSKIQQVKPSAQTKSKDVFLKTLSKIDLFIIKMVDDLDEKKNADHCNFENNQTYFFWNDRPTYLK